MQIAQHPEFRSRIGRSVGRAKKGTPLEFSDVVRTTRQIDALKHQRTRGSSR
ncbi:hypothetical protein X777_06818 [Ooceraea biroi]|uniref:Uncharacterized protein n=1 Tax=Ooceraea biroi TaxID=2015173 RepID=A0A026WDH0_OOCBI|nr:hypothetical protein X777_06818 [Ooceraea biroi]